MLQKLFSFPFYVLIIFALLPMLLFISMSICLSPQFIFAQQSSSQSNETSINFSTFENSTLGLSFQFPSTWNKTEIPPSNTVKLIQLTAPNNSSGIILKAHIVIAIKQLPNDTDLYTYTLQSQEMLNKVSTSNSTLGTDMDFGSFRYTTLAGSPAYERISTQTNPFYLFIHEIFTLNNQRVYTITYYAEPSQYSLYLSIFQKLINSFRIT